MIEKFKDSIWYDVLTEIIIEWSWEAFLLGFLFSIVCGFIVLFLLHLV